VSCAVSHTGCAGPHSHLDGFPVCTLVRPVRALSASANRRHPFSGHRSLGIWGLVPDGPCPKTPRCPPPTPPGNQAGRVDQPTCRTRRGRLSLSRLPPTSSWTAPTSSREAGLPLRTDRSFGRTLRAGPPAGRRAGPCSPPSARDGAPAAAEEQSPPSRPGAVPSARAGWSFIVLLR
jgi:hypothetical protein